MEPTSIRFGGGSAGTVLHPLVAAVLVVAIGLMFLLPRKHAFVPLLFTAILVPFGQVVVLVGAHFTVYRILILFASFRFLTASSQPGVERLPGGFNAIDRLFVLWALFGFVVFSLQWMEVQAIVRSLGTLLDAMGGYFLLRFLIRDRDDIVLAIKVLVVSAVVLAICMTGEQLSHENVFGLLGGMPSAVAMRDGEARSSGSFEVYITAGVFGATLLPLFVWLWKSGASRAIACVGLIASLVITVTSRSSTPQLAYAAGILGLCFWPLRRCMRGLRWGIATALCGLHLIMKAPVWALISRIDLTGSSSGFHRYMLLDGCISHLGDWWFMGYKNYNDWGWDMWDLSNQYVEYALTGGLITLTLFVGIIARSFGLLGTARKVAEDEPQQEWLLWCLGAALLSHVVAYFGVAYFDQMQFAWFALLAMISCAASQSARVSHPRISAAYESTYQDEASIDWPVLGTNS